MGSSLSVSPFVILVSLAVWTPTWGIAGAILCVPIMAIEVIFSEIDATRPLAIPLSKDASAWGPGDGLRPTRSPTAALEN